jgi:hypothetical protein
MFKPSRVVLAVTIAFALVFTACTEDDNGDGESTATAPPAANTAAPDPSPTSTLGIRNLDLSQTDPVVAAIEATEGAAQFVQENVTYIDLTEDGVDDAVVPLSSGGTLGDIAFLVLELADDDDGVNQLVSGFDKEGRGIAVAVVDGVLTMTRPIPGPDDPECCPSMLEITTYGWNGSALAIDDVETVVNPDAGAKGTPSAAGTPIPTLTPGGVAREGTAASSR